MNKNYSKLFAIDMFVYSAIKLNFGLKLPENSAVTFISIKKEH